MNRADVAIRLLMQLGTVTNEYIAAHYPHRVYCWRNAVAEAKKILPPGCEIVANMKGEWKNRAYTLKRPQGQLSLI